MRSRSRAIGVIAVLSLVSMLLMLPEAASQSPTSSPTDTESASPSESASPTDTASPSATGSASPSPGASATPKPLEAEKPGRSTDTEYLKIQIDQTGKPTAAWLKDWIRLRGRGDRTVSDPATFADVKYLSGTPGGREGKNALTWDLGIGKSGFKDIYYEGRLQQQGDYWVTPDGLKPLPLNVQIRYFTGEEGSEEEVSPEALEAQSSATRFKIVITLTNMTKRQQEIAYTDIQSKKTVTATAPVYTPYVARVVDLTFPDADFDQIRSDGDMTRTGRDTIVNWTRNLVPPDFAAEQNAIVTGVLAKGGKIPKISIVAQPVFPPLDAEALTSEGIQFERGRRNFFYDVFGLFRENLIALTGLFGLLHDSFANLSIPLLGPDKGNRESGSFDDPNQLWALWTLAKGLEQADRALNVLQNAVELSRDATKGQLATLQTLRLFVGFSSDPPTTGVGQLAELQSANDLLFNSIWSDLKAVAQLCGATGWSIEQRPYFPDAPAVVTPLCPTAAVPLNLAFLKLAIVEHDMHAIQKENHILDTANLAGLAPLPAAPGGCGADVDTPAGQTCNSYNKYNFIKFPFGMEELERGLYLLKTKGFDPLQAALGNKDTPNSLIWALHVLTSGAEAQVDAFHQLGSTWRFLADSIQNFAIFGVETARSTLQWDINAIDIDTGVKAAAVDRAKEMATFMGRPMDPDKKPAVGQLVLTFSTESLAERPMATDTAMGKFSLLLASALILLVLFGFARFRWFVI
ncbi:MAG: hypothetical protein WAT66_01285 [Actinomycetota bacterium]